MDALHRKLYEALVGLLAQHVMNGQDEEEVDVATIDAAYAIEAYEDKARRCAEQQACKHINVNLSQFGAECRDCGQVTDF